MLTAVVLLIVWPKYMWDYNADVFWKILAAPVYWEYLFYKKFKPAYAIMAITEYYSLTGGYKMWKC